MRQWIYTLRAMRIQPKSVTLYLSASAHFDICAYSDDAASDLNQLEARIGGELVRHSADAFLSWAF